MPVSILVVDDETEVREMLLDKISAMGHSCETAENGMDALKRLSHGQFDILIADIRMPVMDGMALLKEAKARFPGLDVIMMTGFGMDYTYMDVINAGATDFISKPFSHEELEAKLHRILRERRLKSELLFLSKHDSLTNLANRRHFFERFREEVRRARRQKHCLSCILIDVDHFKRYNDSNGHPAGDRILIAVSDVILSSIRSDVDEACRYGGDEFGIILVETDERQARRIAERIRQAFESKRPGGCTLSIGVAQLSGGDTELDLLRRADRAMYMAKRAGGNQVKSLSLDRENDEGQIG